MRDFIAAILLAVGAALGIAQDAWASCPSSTLSIPFQTLPVGTSTGTLTDSAGNSWSYSVPAIPSSPNVAVPVTLTPATCGAPTTPTLVAKASCTSASGSVCTTPPIDMRGANLIVVAVAYGHGSVLTSPIDSSSNTYALGVTTTGSVAVLTCDYVFAPTVTNAMTFSGNFNSGGTTSYGAVSVAGFSGAGSSLDQKTSANSEATGTTTSQQPGSITPTRPNELVLACLGLSPSAFGGSSSNVAIDSGYTIDGVANATYGITEGAALAHLVQGTAAATNPSFRWTTGMYGYAGVLSFK